MYTQLLDGEKRINMTQSIWPLVLLLFAALPIVAQDNSDHIEVGAFAGYFRYSWANSPINFVGLGGRAAFNVDPDIQIEAETAYDFNSLRGER